MANMRRKDAGGRRQGSRWLALAGYTGLGLGCLALAAVTFLVLAAPVELVRDRIVQDVKARTGRDVAIAGPLSLVLFPKLAIALGDVSLLPPPGMGGEPTLRVETVQAELSFASLFSQQGGLERLVLTRPVVELRVDAQGRRSWEAAAGPRSERAGAGGDARQSPPASRLSRPAGTEPGGVKDALSVSVIGGSVRYIDERDGSRYQLGSLDLSLAVGQNSGPVEAKGQVLWQGEKIAFEVALSTLQTLQRDEKARVAFRLAGSLGDASYEGMLSLDPGPALDGTVTMKSASVGALAAWLGGAGSAALAQDPGALSLSSRLSSGKDEASLSELSATVGGTSLSGALKIATAGSRPRVSGSLQVSELDFGRLLVRAAQPERASRPTPKRGDPADARTKEGAAKPPEVQGPTRRDGAGADWSDDTIDFAPLGLADADLSLSADRVVHKELKIGPARLALRLEDRVARITLEDMALYGGRGRGEMTLDGSGQVPSTTANLTLQGVSAHPLLKDALGFDLLEGRSTITVALASQGTSERRMIESLNGKVNVATLNGAIRGFDVDKLVRSIEQGRFGDLGVSAAEKTPFSELAGSYTIANGIAQNGDLRLASPRLRLTGEGTIDMPQRRLDYTVNPKLAAGAATPGAVINVKEIEIPVRIEGSWDKPRFALKGQEQLIETVRQIGKNIKSKDVEEALKGLLGGGDGQRVKPRELLERFLKKQ